MLMCPVVLSDFNQSLSVLIFCIVPKLSIENFEKNVSYLELAHVGGLTEKHTNMVNLMGFVLIVLL
jgi:hypothetical protein